MQGERASTDDRKATSSRPTLEKLSSEPAPECQKDPTRPKMESVFPPQKTVLELGPRRYRSGGFHRKAWTHTRRSKSRNRMDGPPWCRAPPDFTFSTQMTRSEKRWTLWICSSI